MREKGRQARPATRRDLLWAGMALLSGPGAEVTGQIGQLEMGLCLLAETLAMLEASGQGYLLAEAYRLQGVLLLQQVIPETAQVEVCFQQALTIARRQ
jgi:hypothetical protein